MRYSPYPAYKPSDVEWLGELPEGWEVKRLKYSSSINDETLPETTDPGFEFSYVDISSVNSDAGIIKTERMAFEDAPSRARRIVRDGDTIVSTVRTYLRAIAPIREPEENLIVSTGFAVVRPRSIDPDFLSYALRESGFIDTVVARYVGGSYPAVNASDIATIPIPFPPCSEQHAIADFLDRETTRIDTLVAKRRALIEKLKEKRTALISQTVTHGLPPDAARDAGLDPHPTLKPSGVEWLGEVPEHWEIKRLKFLLDEALKYGANESAELDDPDLPRYVRITDIDDTGGLRADTFRSLPQEVAEPYLLKNGDMLFARSGATSGKTFLYDPNWGTCAFAGYLIRARFRKEKALPTFVKYFTSSANYWQWLSSTFIQSTIQNVSAERYGDLLLPVPPLHEQHAIADFLDRETAKIDRMVSLEEAVIEHQQEYRSALITAAVTGKIDVRGSSQEHGVEGARRAEA